MICSQINSHAFFAREKIYTAELHIASQSKSKIWCAAYLTDFSLFLAILLRMAKNSPFSERLNDSGTLSHTLPKALPLESGREQAAPCTHAVLCCQLQAAATNDTALINNKKRHPPDHF